MRLALTFLLVPFAAALSVVSTQLHAVNVTIDDSDPSITYSADWRVSSSSAAENSLDFDGSLHFSVDPKATASFVFQGTALYILSPLFSSSSNGSAGVQVAIDGQAPSVVSLVEPSTSHSSSASSSSSPSTTPSNTASTPTKSLETRTPPTRQSHVVFAVTDLFDGPHSVVFSMPEGAETVILDGLIFTTSEQENNNAGAPIPIANPILSLLSSTVEATSVLSVATTTSLSSVSELPQTLANAALSSPTPPSTTSFDPFATPTSATASLPPPSSVSVSASGALFSSGVNVYNDVPVNAAAAVSGSSSGTFISSPATTLPSQSQTLAATTQRTIVVGAVLAGVVLLILAIALALCIRRGRVRRRTWAEPEWATKYAAQSGPESPFAPRIGAVGYASQPPSRQAGTGYGYGDNGRQGYAGQFEQQQPMRNVPPSSRLVSLASPSPAPTQRTQTRVPVPRSPLATSPPIVAAPESEMQPQPFAYGFPLPPSSLSVPPTPSTALLSPTTSFAIPSPSLYSPQSSQYSQFPNPHSAPLSNPFSSSSLSPLPPRTPAPTTPLPLTPLPPATPGTPWSTTKSRRRSDSEASTASRYSFSSTVETTLGYGWTNANASAGAGSMMPSLVGIHPFSASAGTSVQSVPPRVPKQAVRVTAYAPALSEKAALAAIDRARDEAEEQRGGEPSAPAYREKDAAQLFGVRLRDVPANVSVRAEATTSVITVAPPYEP
ncbi:hypothetical protein C8F01DRAFT_1174875 [Mycena amicta]|nr:hypothetical protein C8F01DRAFT_1174875 [Mycena amicta]